MHGRSLLLPFVLLASTTLLACPKSDPSGASSGATSASTASTATPSASVVASAVPSASADPTTAVSAQPSASAVAVAPSTSGSAAPKASGEAVACGTKPQPDCPLQAWMKANMNPAMAAGDTAALATALEKASTFAPTGYANWGTIAKDGSKAAKGGDLNAAKASCRTCHDQYKQKYKTEMRARKI